MTDEPQSGRQAPPAKPPAKRPPRRRSPVRRKPTLGERAGLAFTGAVKLVGLLIAANEAFLETNRDPVAFAVAAFMMAGATGLDNLLSSIMGNRGEPPP